MQDEDGVKGWFICDWIGNVLGAYQPPNMLDSRSHIVATGALLHKSRSPSLLPGHARSVRMPRPKPINTHKVHGGQGSTEILQTRFLGSCCHVWRG